VRTLEERACNIEKKSRSNIMNMKCFPLWVTQTRRFYKNLFRTDL